MNKGKWLLAIGFGLVAILNSCKEDTGGVGANVLPNSDIISVYATDTTTVLTSMYLTDSALTNGTNNAMLGSYSDPVFGTAKASIYAMIYSTVGSSSIAWNGQYTSSPYSNYILNADTGAVDSAVLFLPVAGFYGTSSQQTFLVYQTTGIIGTGKAYYSDTTMAYNPIPIGTAQQTPNLATSDTIRIKLSRTWLNGILASMNSNSSYYYPDIDSLIHGLYITMSNTLQLPGQGAIYYINLNSSFSGITFYWHSIEPTVPQPEYRINFPVGNNGGYVLTGYFTHVDHNYSTAAFASEPPIGKKDSINGNNLVYVQSMGGVVGRINFPNFYKNWSKLGPVIVNKAEVDMTVDIQDCPNPFVPPANLILGGTDKYGNPYNLPDENAITQLFGGAYDPFNYTYTFNITDYMQNIIQNKDTDRGLFIVPANGPITANRVVLYGAQHGAAIPSANRMKLIMYYSPLATHKATKH
ncbi:MAG TPA: DUF4270 family protein [Bacteroidia bacterium]|jgi:hypothetical protein|nr:DUF4270 family protein [Bacteroidia bacterium]